VRSRASLAAWGYLVLVLLGLTAPFFVYPVFAMNVLCLALFASAFNLLLGYTGLLSFGHAAFLGAAAYVTGLAVKNLGAARRSSASSRARRSPHSSASCSARSRSGAPGSTSR
jgi:ABC-type branched-subunit amino acid transport system permease subunit